MLRTIIARSTVNNSTTNIRRLPLDKKFDSLQRQIFDSKTEIIDLKSSDVSTVRCLSIIVGSATMSMSAYGDPFFVPGIVFGGIIVSAGMISCTILERDLKKERETLQKFIDDFEGHSPPDVKNRIL